MWSKEHGHHSIAAGALSSHHGLRSAVSTAIVMASGRHLGFLVVFLVALVLVLPAALVGFFRMPVLFPSTAARLQRMATMLVKKHGVATAAF